MTAGVENWHGTLNGYTNHRCTQPCCKAAYNAYRNERRPIKVNINPPDMVTLADIVRRDESWMDQALCAGADPEAWFPETGGRNSEAKRVCARCTVRNECLAYALDNEEHFGVWGGLSERDRRKLAKGRAA